MIYQFAKTVKAITDAPGEPVNDFIDLASFLHLIEAKELDTSHINGFDHKEKFDETLLKAQNLLTKLETNEQVQKYIRELKAARRERDRKENEIRREQERRQAEKTDKDATSANRKTTNTCIVFGLCVVAFIISYATNSETLMIWSGLGIIIFGIIIIYRTGAEGKDLK
jgi:lipid II:glycine glycyltransferase (peptidoglycan interpeptide bridge formation enzyme)